MLQGRLTRWYLLLAAGVVGLVAGAILLGKPIRRRLNEARLQRFVTGAVRADALGSFDVAAGNLKAALELNPSHPDALRATARHFTQLGESLGLQFWDNLQDLGYATRADRLAAARLALRCLLADQAAKVLERLQAESPDDPVVLDLLADLRLLEGEKSDSLRFANEAFSRNPDSVAAELKLGFLELLQPGRPEMVAAGRARLMKLTVTGATNRVLASHILLVHGRLNRSDELLLRRFLPPETGEDAESKLVQYALAVRLAPERRAEEFAKLADHLSSEARKPALIQVADWLGELKDFRAILELLPEERAGKDGQLSRIRLGALAGLGDWAGMEAMLAIPRLPLSGAEAAIFRAGVSQAAHRKEEARLRWQLALAECKTLTPLLELLAQHAEATGALDMAASAWERMLGNPRLVNRAANQMLRLGSATRDVTVLLAALKRLVPMHPEDLDLRLNLAFAELFVDRDRAEVAATLALGADRFKDRGLFQVTRALAAFRDGQPDQAFALIGESTINWKNAPSTWKSVRTAILGETGQNGLARNAAAELTPAELGAIELKLVERWLPAGRKAE